MKVYPAAALTLAAMFIAAPAVAEKQVGGQTVSADLAHEHEATRIAVEVVDVQGVKTIVVDTQSGTVTATDNEDDVE